MKCPYCEKGFPLDGVNHIPTQKLGMIPVTRCFNFSKMPTRRDIIALLTWAAHHAGSARQEHANDRDPNGFEKAQKRLEMIERRLHEAAGMLPYVEKSNWTKL